MLTRTLTYAIHFGGIQYDCCSAKKYLATVRDIKLMHSGPRKINQWLFMTCWDLMTKKSCTNLSDHAVLNLSALTIFCSSIKKDLSWKNHCIVSDFLPWVLCWILMDPFRAELQSPQLEYQWMSFILSAPHCCIVLWVTSVREFATDLQTLLCRSLKVICDP